MTALPSLKYISPKPIAPAYPDYLFMRAGLADAPINGTLKLITPPFTGSAGLLAVTVTTSGFVNGVVTIVD